jgi:hypothetical protein
MTKLELLEELDWLREILINVATGGPAINSVDGEYRNRYALVAADLARHRIHNPITFGSL